MSLGMILLIILILLLFGRLPSLGLQPGLGLRSQRRTWVGAGDRPDPRADGSHLTCSAIRAVGATSEAPAAPVPKVGGTVASSLPPPGMCRPEPVPPESSVGRIDRRSLLLRCAGRLRIDGPLL